MWKQFLLFFSSAAAAEWRKKIESYQSKKKSCKRIPFSGESKKREQEVQKRTWYCPNIFLFCYHNTVELILSYCPMTDEVDNNNKIKNAVPRPWD